FTPDANQLIDVCLTVSVDTQVTGSIAKTTIPYVIYCVANLQDLPSVPTRRSSDLCEQLEHVVESGFIYPLLPFCLYLHSVAVARSEEHTSELQSRENLVCRLLREKKNMQYASRR